MQEESRNSSLKPIVDRRSKYKKEKKHLKKLGDERWHIYDHRQNALKWILVCCFGYLGYKNARFGKIEAHESVNAFSREKPRKKAATLHISHP